VKGVFFSKLAISLLYISPASFLFYSGFDGDGEICGGLEMLLIVSKTERKREICRPFHSLPESLWGFGFTLLLNSTCQNRGLTVGQLGLGLHMCSLLFKGSVFVQLVRFARVFQVEQTKTVRVRTG